MTRSINSEGKERDRQIEEAIQGKQDGKYKTYAEAALILKVPQATLYARASGRRTRIQAHEHEQLLSEEEEKELPRWITQLTIAALPPKPYAVKEMAEAIRTRRIIGVNDPSITRVSYDAIGEQWVDRFMNRHPELQSLIAKQIEAVQIKETSHPVLECESDGCCHGQPPHASTQGHGGSRCAGPGLQSTTAARANVERTSTSRACTWSPGATPGTNTTPPR
jgi:hypothetical protein